LDPTKRKSALVLQSGRTMEILDGTRIKKPVDWRIANEAYLIVADIENPSASLIETQIKLKLKKNLAKCEKLVSNHNILYLSNTPARIIDPETLLETLVPQSLIWGTVGFVRRLFVPGTDFIHCYSVTTRHEILAH
jgi:hypothetical protein